MICQRGGLVIQRHNEIRDLEREVLNMVCYDIAIEPLYNLLPRRSSIWEQIQHQMHVLMCTVMDSGRDNGMPFLIYGYDTRMRTRTKSLAPNIYQLHEDKKKRKYASRIIEVKNGTFMPLVFTTTGDMSQECQQYHSRLAKLISSKKQEDYATTIHGSERRYPSPSCGLP